MNPTELFILPFDHRGTFEKKFLGIRGRAPTPAEVDQIVRCKGLIYRGYLRALELGVPRERSGILADEQYSSPFLKDAHSRGLIIACGVEKSGKDELEFEYGADFGAHLLKFSPQYAKVLVRYNPEGDSAKNSRQLAKLKILSDFCREHRIGVMLELLVPPTSAQLEKAGGDPDRFDQTQRPALMIRMIAQAQAAGIEAALWKLEGMDNPEDFKAVIRQVQSGGRSETGVIVLGRGEDEGKVGRWLEIGARTPGVVGFAVGRTLFWDALTQLKDGQIAEAAAVEKIAENYKSFCDLWRAARD